MTIPRETAPVPPSATKQQRGPEPTRHLAAAMSAHGSTRRWGVPEEAAQRLGCTTIKVLHLVIAGELTGYSLGRAVLLDLDEVDALAATRPPECEDGSDDASLG